MVDERWGDTPPHREDHLAALRGATATSQSSSVAPRHRLAREMVLGLTLLLLGAVIVLVFVTRSGGETPTVGDSLPAAPLPSSLVPGDGLALVPALVARGSYPPELMKGDHVIVVVTPDSSDGSPARLLQHDVTVADLSPEDGIGTGAVVTLVGPEILARDIADATSVHISIVRGGDQ